MARPRTRQVNRSVARMAESLSEPIRKLIELHGVDLAHTLGVPQGVATAALSDSIALSVMPGVVRKTINDAVSRSATNKTSIYQAIADLTGTTRQAIDLRQSRPQGLAVL